MRKTRIWIALCCCLFALAVFAWAQVNRKPGLWEMTTTMTFQQSPMPPGVQSPPGSPFSGTPRTTQVCLTQAMIDRYGAPMPQRRDCQVTNVSLRATGMTAEWVCSGQMNGKGSLESSWSDPEHARGKVHFVGTMQMGPRSAPVEWTSESVSTYKGSECGNVQPAPIPANN